MKERDIEKFLRENAPVPPSAPMNEFSSITRRVRKVQISFKYAVPAVLLIVSIMYLFPTRNSFDDKVLAEYLVDSASVVYNDDKPEQIEDFGDEWIYLAEEISDGALVGI